MPCRECEAKCCKYFALQIDTPKRKSDFENIRWYLAHENVSVFVDKRKWFLNVDNKCRYLTDDHQCTIYSRRPELCREHDPTDCEKHHDNFNHTHHFKTIGAFDKYLDKRLKK
jgi:uncharacterized protein